MKPGRWLLAPAMVLLVCAAMPCVRAQTHAPVPAARPKTPRAAQSKQAASQSKQATPPPETQPEIQPETQPQAQPESLIEPPPELPPQYVPNSNQIPLLLAPPPPPPSKPAETSGLRSASEIIKAVLGLAVLFGLAYLASHPRVRVIERRLGISQLITGGLPFVVLGVLASLPGIGVLSGRVLWEIRPLLALGLGWIGFTVGFRFDSKLVETLSPGMGTVGFLTAALPFATIIAACGALLSVTERSTDPVAFVRDALILGTAGAMTARSAPRLLKAVGANRRSMNRIDGIVQLEQLAGIVGLLFVAAFFRPRGGAIAWQLPGTAWLFIAVGVGTTMGGVIYATLGKVRSGPEFSLLMLGSVCFTAGISSFLRLSPVAVCFIAAVVVVNLPGGAKEPVREALERLERPIYLVFLLIAGSLWQVANWQGWLLMALFIAGRIVGKGLAVETCRRRGLGGLSPEERRSLMLGPTGALSIAIVVNAQDLYSSPTIPWMITAVIGGAIVTEIIVQLWTRGRGTSENEPANLDPKQIESTVF